MRDEGAAAESATDPRQGHELLDELAVQKAIWLLETGRAEEAERVLGTHLSTHPPHSRTVAVLALVRAQSDPRSAVGLAEQAVALDPHDPVAHRLRAVVLLAEASGKSNREALAAAREAIRLDPHDAGNHVVHARSLGAMRRFRARLRAARRAAELAPHDAQVLLQLAHAEFALSRERSGMRTVARAAAVEPLDIDVRNSLALVALRSMRPAAAASLYLSVLRDDPLNKVARHNLRSIHEIVGWALTLLLIWLSLPIADAAIDGASVVGRFPFALAAVALGVAGWWQVAATVLRVVPWRPGLSVSQWGFAAASMLCLVFGALPAEMVAAGTAWVSEATVDRLPGLGSVVVVLGVLAGIRAGWERLRPWSG